VLPSIGDKTPKFRFRRELYSLRVLSIIVTVVFIHPLSQGNKRTLRMCDSLIQPENYGLSITAAVFFCVFHSCVLSIPSQPPNLHTFITSYLFNFLAALALRLLLLLLGHRHHPL